MAKKTTERKKLTFSNVKALEAPKSGRRYVYDEAVRPLAVCVTTAGTKTWYYYGRIDGRPERVRLGKFPVLRPDDARKAAHRIAGEIAAGDNPQADKRATRGDVTLAKAFSRFKLMPSKRTKTPKRPATLAAYERQYKAHLADWGERKLADITDDAVQARHAKIGRDNGPYMANRTLALLRAIYRASPKLGYKGDDPTRHVDLFPEHSRIRSLKTDELNRFMAVLDDHPDQDLADLIRLALWTGARRSNVCGMRWDQLDLDAELWIIDAADTKTHEPYAPALSPQAVTLLNARKLLGDPESPFVFPSRKAKSGHLEASPDAFKKMLADAEIDGLRFHDLRHTAASWLSDTGAPLQVIADQLGHKNLQTTKKYAHRSNASVRAAVEKSVAAMGKAAGKGGKT